MLLSACSSDGVGEYARDADQPLSRIEALGDRMLLEFGSLSFEQEPVFFQSLARNAELTRRDIVEVQEEWEAIEPPPKAKDFHARTTDYLRDASTLQAAVRDATAGNS